MASWEMLVKNRARDGRIGCYEQRERVLLPEYSREGGEAKVQTNVIECWGKIPSNFRAGKWQDVALSGDMASLSSDED